MKIFYWSNFCPSSKIKCIWTPCLIEFRLFVIDINQFIQLSLLQSIKQECSWIWIFGRIFNILFIIKTWNYNINIPRFIVIIYSLFDSALFFPHIVKRNFSHICFSEKWWIRPRFHFFIIQPWWIKSLFFTSKITSDFTNKPSFFVEVIFYNWEMNIGSLAHLFFTINNKLVWIFKLHCLSWTEYSFISNYFEI